MFIFLDESLGQKYDVVGCLCVPLKSLPKIESNFIDNRIKNNCWGELDWSGISKKYIEKYKHFLTDYFSNKDVTFHSWAYEKPDEKYCGDKKKLLFQHEYSLLKNTLIKCVNNKYKEFYILLDEGQSITEYGITREYLERNSKINPKPVIKFYSQIDSKIIGAMQISSLCVSAVRYKYETISKDKNKKLCDQIVFLLEDLNSKIPINFSPKHPCWNLSRKISHCLFDPLLGKGS